jgi:hypothetical protein
VGDASRDYIRSVDVGKPKTLPDGRVEASIEITGGEKFYACTAYDVVDGDREESDYSNEVEYGWMPVPRVVYDIGLAIPYYLGSNTDETYAHYWKGYGSKGNRVYGRNILPSEHTGGIANAINLYQVNPTESTHSKACLLKKSPGDTYFTLIGLSTDIDGYNVPNAWTGWINLLPVSGQSLLFASTDQLMPGMWISGAVGADYMAKDSGDPAGGFYFVAPAGQSSPPDTISPATSAQVGFGFNLRYTKIGEEQ